MSCFQYGGIIENVATTATAAGTTTLTNTSPQLQVFTGTATQTIVLPNATTFTAPGTKFEIYNQSTSSLSIKYQDTTPFSPQTSVAAGTSLTIHLTSNGTANGTWAVETPNNGGGGGGSTPGLSLNAGFQTYSAAGTYTWTVPTGVTRVIVEGCGGGGGGAGSGGAGGNGGTTTFNGVIIGQGAYGGNHISGGAVSGPVVYDYFTGGYNGTAGQNSQGYTGGGGVQTSGGGAASDYGNGGASGNPASGATGNGAGGGSYNNGTTVNGGGGGCVRQMQIFEDLTPGSNITVVVGAGGAAGGSAGAGSDGICIIHY